MSRQDAVREPPSRFIVKLDRQPPLAGICGKVAQLAHQPAGFRAQPVGFDKLLRNGWKLHYGSLPRIDQTGL